MNMSLFVVLLSGLGLCYLWIGRRATRLCIDEEEYFLMGRNLGFIGLTLTILATQVGGGTLLGVAEDAYERGWVVLFYPLGVSLGLLVLAAGFGSRLRRLNLSTVPELFETIYGSKALRRIAASLSVFGPFIILVAIGVAARKFFATLGLQNPYLFVGLWLLFVFYTVMGGLRAVVNTDMLQMIFIIVCLIATVIWVALRAPLPIVGSGEIFGSGVGVPWTTWLLGPMLYMLIEQDMGQRCFAAKTAKIVAPSAILSAVLLFACSLMAVAIGVLGRRAGVVVPAGQSVLLATVAAFGGPVIATFFATAILMAIVSTGDSLLCSISSNLSMDFPWANKRVKLAQWITFGVGIAALMGCFFFENIVAVMMFSYQLSVSILFIPVTFALWTKRAERGAAWGAIIGGAATFVVLNFMPWNGPVELVACFVSAAGYFIGGRVVSRKETVMLRP